MEQSSFRSQDEAGYHGMGGLARILRGSRRLA
jgi:hypothetical protein